MAKLSRMVNRSKINDYFLDLAHLIATACHLSYSKRWARRGSGGKDSPNRAYRSDGPCRHNMSHLSVILKVVFEDKKI